MTDPDPTPPRSPGIARLVADVRRLWSLAVKFGAILAIVCHLLPPHYRPVCDALASICTGGN